MLPSGQDHWKIPKKIKDTHRSITPINYTPITDSEHIITHTVIGTDSRFLPILSGELFWGGRDSKKFKKGGRDSFHRVVSGDVGVGKMDMGHLCDFDETHRTGSTQDGLHADAAHASLATLHRILLLTQTRTSVLLRATRSGESVRGNVTKGEKSERATNTELPSQTNSNL